MIRRIIFGSPADIERPDAKEHHGRSECNAGTASQLKELIAKGKEQGYLTYAEVNDHLPEDISDPDQIEDIIRMITEMGIKVFEQAPDADELLTAGDSSADELAAEEAAAALAAVETEVGRTTDPVRMYMREMGTVELLTREGEIEIAKRIEEGLRDVMAAVSQFPGTVEYIVNAYDQAVEDDKLTDVLIGYLDPTDDAPVPRSKIAMTAIATMTRRRKPTRGLIPRRRGRASRSSESS